MKIEDLAKTITAELKTYTKEIDDTMQDEIDRLSKELVKDLENDPIIPKKSGDYRKGFYLKKLAQGNGYKRNVIANKKYQLTHLLEYGHLKRNGTKRTKEFPHWEHAQEKADTLPQRIKEAVES